MSENPTIIETPRLILREIDVKTDLDMWTDMMSDADTVRYIGGETMDRAKSWRQMAMLMGHYQIRGYGFLAVVEKSSGQFIGRIGPWYPVIHVIAHGNIGSIKTAEAIGSRHIGELEEIPGVTKMSCHIYGQDKL